MMIPIPRAGILRGVDGIEAAKAVPGIVDIEITARTNYPIQTLPEGSSYLGFIFARGADPASVERALRIAHERLRFDIRGMVSMQISNRTVSNSTGTRG